MRFYPDIPAKRARWFLADLLVVLLLLVFALLALEVRHTVDRLAVVSQGVEETGGAVQNGFGDAADAVDDIPVIGGDLADALESAGRSSGGEVESLGRQGVDRTHRLADLLSLLTFFVPAAAILVQYLPGRVARTRRLRAAAKVLAEPSESERRRLVAMRAAFALPYELLLRHTPDPLGDLAAERYDALIRAATEEVGLRAPPEAGSEIRPVR
jgi:hypothetical protein